MFSSVAIGGNAVQREVEREWLAPARQEELENDPDEKPEGEAERRTNERRRNEAILDLLPSAHLVLAFRCGKGAER
jgi:hypothetical protein